MPSRLPCSANGPSGGRKAPWWGHPARKRSASHLRASEMRIRREQRLLPLPSRGTSRAIEPSRSSSKRLPRLPKLINLLINKH